MKELKILRGMPQRLMTAVVLSIGLAAAPAASFASGPVPGAPIPTGPGVTRVTGPTFTSLSALQSWASDNQINVIVTNPAGLPIREFHTDGEDIALS